METALIGTFDTATMLGLVEATPRAKTFLRDRVMARLRPVETQDVVFDFRQGNRAMAPIVNRKIGGKLVEKLSTVAGKYRPPMLAPRDVFGADEAFERAPGEVFGGAMSADERAAAHAARAFAQHERLITRRWEWMIAKLLTTGKIPIEGVGVDDEIDVSHTLAVVLAGADLWSADTSDPLGDLDDWTDQIIEESGLTPDTLILGKTAAQWFLAHADVQARLDNRRFEIGMINPREIPNGAIYVGTINGLDIFRYPEWYRHDTTGASTPMIPATMAVLCCSGARNPDQEMVFGAHYEVSEDRVYAADIVPRVWVDKGSNTRFMEAVSYPVPIIPQVDSWLYATVC